MISAINQEIAAFLSSVKGVNESSNQMILDKFSTSISDNLKNGHLTTNVCMIAASVLKLNPKGLAEDLEKHLKGLELFKDVVSAGPGFINITLKRKDFVSVLLKIKKLKRNLENLRLAMIKECKLNSFRLTQLALFMLDTAEALLMEMRLGGY